ncbi:MAG: aminotransferase class V-fold PLP-dependent enzyme, partial [Longimicrobiales bacterium]
MIGEVDVARFRADTPGTDSRLHLNNAGAALMPAPVIEAIRAHLDLETRIGGYEARAEADEAVHGAYRAVATLLHTESRHIAFTEHATASFQAALSSIPCRT